VKRDRKERVKGERKKSERRGEEERKKRGRGERKKSERRGEEE
jgi:hypothetical protein